MLQDVMCYSGITAQGKENKVSEQKQKQERKNNTVATVLDVEHKDLVTLTARAYGVTASEVVRRAVEAYFENRPDIVSMLSDMPELPGL